MLDIVVAIRRYISGACNKVAIQVLILLNVMDALVEERGLFGQRSKGRYFCFLSLQQMQAML